MNDFFTARTIKNKIGLPVEECEKNCTPHCRQSDGKTVYSLAEAQKVKEAYLAGKADVIARRKARFDAGLCGRKINGKTLCPNRRVRGYAYCEDHLPPSVKRIRKSSK